MTRTVRLALAIALALAAVAPAAEAATVASRADPPSFSDKDGTLDGTIYTEYTADPGERNRLTVRKEGPDRVVFEDPGATIRAGRGCEARSEHAVACPLGNQQTADLGDGEDVAVAMETFISVRGGDGADALRVAAGPGNLSGGPGDDRLTGGTSGDVLFGGPGADRLEGGPGDDTLLDLDFGGPGEDLPGSDVYDGGAGRDAVDYGGRSAPLASDLARGTTAGAAGERDRLGSVETVTGGDGNDRIGGTGRGDEISGGPGHDVLLGLGGDDDLYGGGGEGDRIDAGRGNDTVGLSGGADVVALGPGDDRADEVQSGDRVDAGPGDDRLGLLDAEGSTRIRCGPGIDTGTHVEYLGALLVPEDCEEIRFGGAGRVRLATLLNQLGAAVPAPRFRCPADAQRGCRVRFELRRVRHRTPTIRQALREPLLGSSEAIAGTGRRARLPRLRLSAAGRRLLARRGRLDVRVGVRWRRGRRPIGPAEPASFVIRLRAPRGAR